MQGLREAQSSSDPVHQAPKEEEASTSAKVADWEFPMNAYGFSRPLTMPLNMVDPVPIPSTVKLLLPAASNTTGGIPLPPQKTLPVGANATDDNSTSCPDDNQLDNKQIRAKLDKMFSMSQTGFGSLTTQFEALKTAASASRTSLNGDAPTLKEVKELMMAAEMPIPVDSKLMGKMMANCPNDEIMAKLSAMQVESSCAATDGVRYCRAHNKMIGISEDSDSDEADRRKLRLFDGISVQGSTSLAARRRISKEQLSEDNIRSWTKALPKQGA